MSKESRQERRDEAERIYREQQAAVKAHVAAERIRKATKQEDEARALLDLAPEELALKAAKALLASRNSDTVHQQTACLTESVAYSNLALLSALGAMTVQPEQHTTRDCLGNM